jgi:Protein of unknown function (DUF664)
MTTDLAKTAATALTRHLEVFRDAVRDLSAPLSDAQFWSRPIEPGNSIGHLVLHLTGNLNHRVGALLGGTGYVRDREREFSEANIPSKTDTLAKLDDAVATFRRVVEGLDADRLAAPFPDALYPNVLDGLIALLAHFALHRGQMSYLARLVKK